MDQIFIICSYKLTYFKRWRARTECTAFLLLVGAVTAELDVPVCWQQRWPCPLQLLEEGVNF